MKCPYECRNKTSDGHCKNNGCINNKYNPMSFMYSAGYLSDLKRKR